MEINTMSVQAECECCQNQFVVNATNGTMMFKQQFECGDKILFLTYYTCPKCGKRHYSQVDDNRTNTLCRDVSRHFVRLSKILKLNKSVPQKQNDKFKKAYRHLALLRKALMDEYTGKTVVEVSDGKVVENLKFSKESGESYEAPI